MPVGGRAFDGSTALLNAYERLTPLAGYSSWFTEFRPLPSFYFDFIERLLLIFFKHNICCNISGSYETYLAGVTNSFRGVTVYSPSGCPSFKSDFSKGRGPRHFSGGRISLCAGPRAFGIRYLHKSRFERRRLPRSPILLESTPLEFAGPAPMSISYISCGNILRDSISENTL
jgi:hypothetical protein